MASNGKSNGAYLSWQWFSVALFTIIIGIGGYSYASIDSRITDLDETKMENTWKAEVYQNDIGYIKEALARLEQNIYRWDVHVSREMLEEICH